MQRIDEKRRHRKKHKSILAEIRGAQYIKRSGLETADKPLRWRVKRLYGGRNGQLHPDTRVEQKTTHDTVMEPVFSEVQRAMKNSDGRIGDLVSHWTNFNKRYDFLRVC